MKDPTTQRSRGFGFVNFENTETVDRVINYGKHEIDEKFVDPKIAFPKRGIPKMITKTKKIFVGGLSSNTDQEDLRNYFNSFGPVEDVMLMYDRQTQRHRGFAFINFTNESTVETVVERHFHEINGKKVECKKAQPKEVMQPALQRAIKARAVQFSGYFGGLPNSGLGMNMNLATAAHVTGIQLNKSNNGQNNSGQNHVNGSTGTYMLPHMTGHFTVPAGLYNGAVQNGMHVGGNGIHQAYYSYPLIYQAPGQPITLIPGHGAFNGDNSLNSSTVTSMNLTSTSNLNNSQNDSLSNSLNSNINSNNFNNGNTITNPNNYRARDILNTSNGFTTGPTSARSQTSGSGIPINRFGENLSLNKSNFIDPTVPAALKFVPIYPSTQTYYHNVDMKNHFIEKQVDNGNFRKASH